MLIQKVRPVLGLILVIFAVICIFQDSGMLISTLFLFGGILLIQRELKALAPFAQALFVVAKRRIKKVEATRHCFLCGGPARYVIVTAALDPDKPIPLDSARSSFYICRAHHPNPRKELPREERHSAQLLWYLEQNNLTYELVLDWIQGMHH